jgi:hypothetical protein
MPVKKLAKREAPPKAQALASKLVQEWKAKNSKASQPVILEDAGRSNQPFRVYVVWDDWEDLTGIERSEIIMDAYEEVYGKTKAVNVTVAMGLTTEEAQRLGIH